MIQQKAKFYPEVKDLQGNPKIVPLETKPNFTELTNPSPKPEYKGTDEHGDWILIDFIHGDDTFMEYKVYETKDKYGRKVHDTCQIEITEKEWDQIEADSHLETTNKKPLNVSVDAPTSKRSKSISTGKIQQICSTVKKKWSKTMQYLF